MFQVGDRVYIVEGKEYKGRFIGCSGEIVRISYPTTGRREPKIGIRLDDYSNPHSGYGAFWFDQYNIQYSEEEYNMNEYKRASIRLLGNPYSKATNEDTWVYSTTMDDLKQGDILVVHTNSHGLAVAEFISYTEEKMTKPGREIMAKADLSEYQARKEREKKVLELKRQMDKTLKEAQDLALYEAIAKNNPTMAALLDEYKALVQGTEKAGE